MNNIKDELTAFIKKHEGYRSKPYKDTVGKWTVFYGRNISDVVTTTDELLALLQQDNAQDIADLFIENDIKTATSACQLIFNNFDYYTDVRQIALISIMFNLGINRFRGFKKMIQAIDSYEWDEAHNELLDSRRAKQLPCRSKEEANMLRVG